MTRDLENLRNTKDGRQNTSGQEVAATWRDPGGTVGVAINDIKSKSNSAINNLEDHVGNQRETSVKKLSSGEISNSNDSSMTNTLQIGKAKSLVEEIRRARRKSFKKDLRVDYEILTVLRVDYALATIMRIQGFG